MERIYGMVSSTPTMTPQEFIQKWRNTSFGERQAAHMWFLDLLKGVGHPDPAEFNEDGEFTFEKAVPGGFADAYLEGCFGWEFKGAEAQLPGAFDHLSSPMLTSACSTSISDEAGLHGERADDGDC